MVVGSRVKVQKVYEPWKKRFNRRVGVIEDRREVHPSKNVPDGLIWKVRFEMIDRKTGKVGVSESFSTKQLVLAQGALTVIVNDVNTIV